jgi:hypothetical protein
MPFVHAGPFTLDGGWNFWVGFPTWLIWFAIYSYYMLRYIRGQMVQNARRPLSDVDEQLGDRFALSVDG